MTRTYFLFSVSAFLIATATIATSPAHADPEPILSSKLKVAATALTR